MFTDAAAMHVTAAALLVRLNGVVRLQSDSFRPVILAGRYDRPDPAVDIESTIHITDTAHARDRVVVVEVGGIESGERVGTPIVWIDGTRVDQRQGGGRYLALVAAHSDVAELLSLVGNADRSKEQLGSSGALIQRVADAIADPCPPATDNVPCRTPVHTMRSSIPGGIAVAAPVTRPSVNPPLGWTLSEETGDRDAGRSGLRPARAAVAQLHDR